MVAADVDDLGAALLEHLEDGADETGVGVGPAAGAAQLPAIDDVAVEDEFFAADVFEEVVDLGDAAGGGAEVDVGEDDGFDAELLHARRS